MAKKAIIIGAGPAGLTAAYELLTRTDIEPVILEENDFVGGISATLDYKHNKIDMGGHRFFSKSEREMCIRDRAFPLYLAFSTISKILIFVSFVLKIAFTLT